MLNSKGFLYINKSLFLNKTGFVKGKMTFIAKLWREKRKGGNTCFKSYKCPHFRITNL